MVLEKACFRFRDFSAVVIGGGKGIGKATCHRLAAEGAAKVVVADRDLQAAQQVVTDLQRNCGSVVAAQVDVSKPEEVNRLFTDIGKDVDVLINSAGRMGVMAFQDLSPQVLTEEFGTSVYGLVWAMQEAAVAMRARQHLGQNRFAIVNIASTAALHTFPGLTAYGTAKASVRHLTRSAAAELAPFNIRVNTIIPAGVDTEGIREWAATLPEQYQKDFAEQGLPKLMPRLAQPEEIAAGIAFLASSDASFMTGSELVMDGGMTI